MEKVGKILETVLKNFSLNGQLEGWKAVSLWNTVVGERAAGRTRAVSYRDGKLIVEVTSSVWMKELTYLRQDILRKLNDALGEERIKEVVLKRG
jgi:predicted nucleic acid-binding Zn ribbon protein